MTRSFIGVTAYLLLLPTRLRASSSVRVFALPRTMARLAAEMRAALQLLATNITTPDVSQPTRLILQCFLPTHATLLAQEWALGARIVVLVAVVSYLWMTTSFWSLTGIPTRRGNSTAREWRLKDGPSAVAADLFEYGLPARPARTLVAEFLADMVTALERSSALPCANVLCFDAIVNWTRSGVEGTLLLFRGLPLDCLALARATALFACVSSTIEVCSTHPPTLRLLLMTLMTNSGRGGPSTTAVDRDVLQA